MYNFWIGWTVIAYVFTIIPSYRNLATSIAIPPTRVWDIWRFPNETWVENIAVRANGQLLVTIIGRPELYQINPFEISPPILIYRFPSAVSVLGITETDPDVFAVVMGNWTLSSNPPGAYSAWTVDMRTFDNSPSSHRTTVKVTKITDIPEAKFLNGATFLSQTSGIVLIADSVAGLVWGLNTRTGEYAAVLKNALMNPVPTAPIQLGINGLHIRGDDDDDNHLYFTNSWQGIFVRVPLHLANGTAAGPYEVVTHLGICDDFSFDERGKAFIATDVGNTLLAVPTVGKEKGVVTILAGNANSTRWAGATATAFGRTEVDGDVLYVTTNGGIPAPIDGHIVHGGRVLAIRMRGLR